MVIKDYQVHYFDEQSLPAIISNHSKVILFVQQHLDTVNQPKLHFFIVYRADKKMFPTKKDNKCLGIPLNIKCQYTRNHSLYIPLETTKKMQQLTNLLFLYYSTKNVHFPIDIIVKLLVNATFEGNSQLLTHEHSYLTLIQFMCEHVDQSLTTKDLCNAIHLSKSALHELCHKLSGLSPIKLFQKIKCCEAYRLLEDTDLSILEIANKLGFHQQSHFSTVFKKFEGITPQQVREKTKNN